jgi:hypothetical protein
MASTHKTVVVPDQYKGRGQQMKGLKVIEGETIPAWGVIGEYTGTMLKTLPKRSKSEYVFQVSETMFIDAEMEGNSMRFINHSCRPNAAYISVTTEGHDTAYVRAIKEIKGGEFISVDYGPTFDMPNCLCDHCWEKNRPRAQWVVKK